MHDTPRIRIDWTHVGRRATGIERITRELFAPEMLAPLPVTTFTASKSKFGVLIAQSILLPWQALTRRRDIFVFPGFPPSPVFPLLAPRRSVLYVHDLFLLTRRDDLNTAGKYYLAPQFALAVRSLPHFFVNSEQTEANLRKFCAPDATIVKYRPAIRNVFELAPGDRLERPASASAAVRCVAIGTIEPRKNLRAAANICAALSSRLGKPVELHLVGRAGWGGDADWLAGQPHVILHGPVSDERVREIVDASDFLLCTSHDEGLGLPLLEVQFAGLPVVAPDQPIFHEVLGKSGLFVRPADAAGAAVQIADWIAGDGWRRQWGQASLANVTRWNDVAGKDRENVVRFLAALLERR